jgi:hypothetical protein
MTLKPITSEFPYECGIFYFCFYQCKVSINFIFRGNHPNVTVKAWGEIMGLIDPDAGK